MRNRIAIVCLMVWMMTGCGAHQARAVDRPNFLFVLVDDLGYKDLGCYGSTFHDTPNLDRLAVSGMRFTQGYAAHPVCSPTRAAIMTGQNPARIGITDWIPGGGGVKNRRLTGPKDKHNLPLEHVTIAEALQSAGYKTFFAGKWHLNERGDTTHFPEHQGFDINKGGHHKGSPPDGYYTPYKNPRLTDGPDGEYLPDRLTDETIRFIERHREGPFLAYLAFYTVHTPIQPCKRHIAAYQKKAEALPAINRTHRTEHDGKTKLRQDNPAYASMVRAMDENVGRLMQTLERCKLTDNTVVIFTSDNGGLTTVGRYNPPTAVLPLRAGKGWCYEGGIRVPNIIRAPGVTKAGMICDVPIYSADFYPTILDLAGLDAMPTQHRDGVSITPLLRGRKKLDRKFIVWHYPHYHGSMWRPGSALRCGDYKLVVHYDYEKTELFNLAEDISEQNDLSEKMPEKTAELRRMLEDYLQSVSAPMPTPNPDYTN